jgi:serine/threonine-protein kinase
MVEDGTTRWQRACGLFDELVELDPPAREARLQALHADDAALAAEVRSLLRADDRAEGVLERSLEQLAPGLTDTADIADAEWETPPGMRLGAYRLLQPLGRGGMGEVWLAERADGEYRQQVALKLLKRGMDTQAILRRFLQERSILARLAHPRIVRLLDGGMSPAGRPWYAMDLVEGRSVTDFAAAEALPMAARIELVAQIADAVAYAHAQLVVHRDLKPSNILVDAEGVPHLLDFGIAKLLEETGDDLATGTGVRLLSPAYAAPEQILGQPVGTATDVYALGVVAFELLTGELPHRRGSRDPGQLGIELERHVGERASAVLARRDAAALAALYGPGADRGRLVRQLAGDLDVILAKALQQDPARRYATAAAFADDLRRWCTGRPIAARPDSARYRLGRFVRRHRLAVATAATAIVLLVAGLGAALWQAGLARQQAQRAELVKQFVLSLLREHDPVARAQAQARTPRELVAEGIERARLQLAGDPRLRLDVLADLGTLPAALGDDELSEQVLTEVLDERRRLDGDDTVATAELKAELASVMLVRGNVPGARALAQAAVDTLTRHLGTDALATARAQVPLLRAMMVAGERETALALARQVHATTAARLGADDPETLKHLDLLASTLDQADLLTESEQAMREVVAGLERRFGSEHARLVIPLTNLGGMARRQQRYQESRDLLQRAATLARQHLGERHPVLGGLLARYGDVLRRLGDYDAAGTAFDQAEVALPAGSGQLGQLWMFRGTLATTRGEHEAAAQAYAQAEQLFLALAGPDSPFPWMAAMERGAVLTTLGRLDQAGPILEQVLERQAAIAGPDSYDAAMAAGRLGQLRRAQGRFPEAIELARRQVGILVVIYGEDHANTADARLELARSLHAAGQLAAARDAYDQVLAHLAPGTSIAAESPAIHLESARLARDQGEPVRARSDAAAALALLAAEADADPARLAEARSLSTLR